MFNLIESKYGLHIVVIVIFLALSLITVLPVLNMILLGAMIAYGIAPLANRIQSKIKFKSISIFLAIILVIIPLILLFLYVFWEIAVFADMFFTSHNLSLASGIDLNFSIATFIQALPIEIQGLIKPYLGVLTNGVHDILTYVFNYAVKFIRNFSDVLVQLFVLICSIFYFTRDGDKLMDYLSVFIPKKHKSFFDSTIEDVANVLKSIFYGHFLTAIIIGIMGGIGYYFLGYRFALFLGIITGVAQLIPIIGPWIVYWALAIYAFFVLGDIPKGIFTILWGFILSLSDMYIRPMLASNYADMPSLIILVGFMAGPYVFGIVGFILGPLVLGIAYALIKSLKEELEKEKSVLEEGEDFSDDY
ncbi:MAG: AI-2E family transporter [Methanobrevibacter olleyae]|uniref:AI-2E family transporter n=1 Tax=Methanobrevibacter olleyae TaxID=294671 RepID=A0A8T3VVD4_METOL|nr:AI-2E family transporter [Methanobrevibacter olleyae]